MASASATLHEDPSVLPAELVDRHRALVSVMEELEAIDWYDQRACAAADDELRGLLAHNRDEEKEHAAMVLEWLRRRDAKLDEMLRRYLFTREPILALEEAADVAESGGADAAPARSPVRPADGSLGLGSLR